MLKINQLILILLLVPMLLRGQDLYFPPLSGSTWDTISPVNLGWCADEIEPLFGFLEANNSKAFIVLKDGKIAIEKYFGTFSEDSLWYWASAGKTLTAFLVGIAQQEGLLSIYDTTARHLGNAWTVCPPAKEEKITIRHQLNMTSGLDDGVPEPYCTEDTCLQYLADAGTRWAYHNAPYTLLDNVLQASTGLPLNIYLGLKLKNPTGMTGFFLPMGYNMVYFSNARSMARFGLLTLSGGNWDGNTVLSDTNYYNQMVNTSQDLNKSYGYLWWLNGKESFMLPGLQFLFPGWLSPNAPEDMIMALGKNGQLINVVPGENLVVIRMGNAPDSGEIGLTLNDSIWHYLNNVICNHTGNITLTRDSQKPLVFPNPTNGYLFVEFKGKDLSATVYNLIGRKATETKVFTGSTRFSLQGLEPGVYIVDILSGQDRWREKIVITRP